MTRLTADHINSFGGIPLIESPNLTIAGPIETVRRTWRERLLSWPWRPWTATYLRQTLLPDPKYYIVDGALTDLSFGMSPASFEPTTKRVIAHPVTMAKIKAAIVFAAEQDERLWS